MARDRSRRPGASCVKAISFDADGTLWDFEGVMRRSLVLTLEELRSLLPSPKTAALTEERLAEVRNEAAAEMLDRGCTMEEIRHEAFSRILEEIDRPDRDLATHLTGFYLERRFEDIELYPDTLPALDALAGAYRLGLVSNGNTYPERCGLGGRFDFVVFAQDHGARKPSPGFYHAVLSEAGVGSDELLHVGDSLANDVEGAQAVGIKAVWLDRTGTANATSARYSARIRHLSELPNVLATLET